MYVFTAFCILNLQSFYIPPKLKKNTTLKRTPEFVTKAEGIYTVRKNLPKGLFILENNFMQGTQMVSY